MSSAKSVKLSDSPFRALAEAEILSAYGTFRVKFIAQNKLNEPVSVQILKIGKIGGVNIFDPETLQQLELHIAGKDIVYTARSL